MSVVFIAEAQSRYVLDAIRAMKRSDIGAVSVKPEAHRAYNESVQRRMKGTAWTEGGCASWYIDDNGLNTSLWPDFAYRFKRELRSFDLENYEALAAPAAASELVGAAPSRV
jgi:hypothetical protein